MGLTHGNGGGTDRHVFIQKDGNFKGGIAIFLNRLIAGFPNQHILIERAAPNNDGCGFAIFDHDFGRAFYGRSAAAASEGNFDGIASICDLFSTAATESTHKNQSQQYKCKDSFHRLTPG